MRMPASRFVAEFTFLHCGLAGVPGFAGVKSTIDQRVHVPPLVSMSVIVAVLGMAI
jgi:hypothetical protein